MAQITYEVPKPLGLNKAQVEDYTVRFAAVLGLRIGGALEPIVQALGGDIEYGAAEDELDGGSIIARDQNDFTIYLSEFTAPIRDRFTIAHELGHLFLHFPKIKAGNPGAIMRATRRVDATDDLQKRAEWEANWFAAALLMPASEFRLTMNKDIEYNAAKFNVSRKAASVRRTSLQ